MAEQEHWLEPLAAAVLQAADSPDELAAIFAALRAEVGAQEAGRRWWAAFGQSDATHT